MDQPVGVVCSVSGTETLYTGIASPSSTFFCVDGVPYTKAQPYTSDADGFKGRRSRILIFSVFLLFLSCFAVS